MKIPTSPLLLGALALSGSSFAYPTPKDRSPNPSSAAEASPLLVDASTNPRMGEDDGWGMEPIRPKLGRRWGKRQLPTPPSGGTITSQTTGLFGSATSPLTSLTGSSTGQTVANSLRPPSANGIPGPPNLGGDQIVNTAGGLLGGQGLGAVSGLAGGLTGGLTGGLQSAAAGLPLVGGLLGSQNTLSGGMGAVGDLPVVGGLVGGLTGQQGLSGVVGGLPVVGGVVSGLPGVGGLVNGLPAVGSIANGLHGVGGLVNGLPVVGGVVSGLPAVGGLVNGLPIIGGLNGQQGQNALNNLPLVGGLAGSSNGLLSGLLGGSQVVNGLSNTAQQSISSLGTLGATGLSAPASSLTGSANPVGQVQDTGARSIASAQGVPSLVGNLGGGKYLLSSGSVVSFPLTEETAKELGHLPLVGGLVGSLNAPLSSAMGGQIPSTVVADHLGELGQATAGQSTPLGTISQTARSSLNQAVQGAQSNGLLPGQIDPDHLIDLNGVLVPLAQAQQMLKGAGYDDATLASVFGMTSLSSDPVATPVSSDGSSPAGDSPSTADGSDGSKGVDGGDQSGNKNGNVPTGSSDEDHLTPAQAFQASDPSPLPSTSTSIASSAVTPSSTLAPAPASTPSDPSPSSDGSDPASNDNTKRFFRFQAIKARNDQSMTIGEDYTWAGIPQSVGNNADKGGYVNPYPFYRVPGEENALDLVADSMGRIAPSSAISPTQSILTPSSTLIPSTIPSSSSFTSIPSLSASASASTASVVTSTNSAVSGGPTMIVDALGRERKGWQRPTDPSSAIGSGSEGYTRPNSSAPAFPASTASASSSATSPASTATTSTVTEATMSSDSIQSASASWAEPSETSRDDQWGMYSAPSAAAEKEGYEWDAEGPWGDWVDGNQ